MMMNLLTSSREEQIFETHHSDDGDEQAEDRGADLSLSSAEGEPVLHCTRFDPTTAHCHILIVAMHEFII